MNRLLYFEAEINKEKINLKNRKIRPFVSKQRNDRSKTNRIFYDNQWHSVYVQKVQSIYSSMRKRLETIYCFHSFKSKINLDLYVY